MRDCWCAAHARSLTPIIARPGGTIQPFCEPVSTTSRSQASIWRSTHESELTASTQIRMSGRMARMAFASAWMSLITPVEVSFCVRKTPLASGRRESASATACGSAAWPHSVSTRVTFNPKVSPTLAKRSPKTPTGADSTASPGLNRLTTVASQPPLPDEGKVRIRCEVWKKC